jgi:hypothetical protein
MITCYDPELDSFADDLAGDFDYLSAIDREAWIARQWTEIAAAMGWAEALDQTLSGLRRSRMGFADLSTAALATYGEHVDRQREDDVRIDRARVRHSVLDDLAQKRPRNLWRVDSQPLAASIQGSCFNLAKWQHPPAHRRSRGPAQAQTRAPRPRATSTSSSSNSEPSSPTPAPATSATPPPSSSRTQGGCGWQTSLRISLGTFPWVYGHRLQSPAPGLAWKSSANYRPAHRALEIASNLWQAEGNLHQDARDVVAMWNHWRSPPPAPRADQRPRRPPTASASSRSATSTQRSRDQRPPRLHQRRRLNYIQRRFAAFFAMRRALIRARTQLIPELRALADQSPDPCLKTPTREVALQRA